MVEDRPFIRYIERHASLPSTNDRALILARDPAIPLPALVVATIQTAGRGCGTNIWWSNAGALTFSIIFDALHPLGTCLPAPPAGPLRPESRPRLSLAAAVSVCDVLDTLAPSVPWRIKWPNDVVAVDGSTFLKIAGILIETPGPPASSSQRIVVGIGINVNNSLANAPHDVRKRGISLIELGIGDDLLDSSNSSAPTIVDSPLAQGATYPLNAVLDQCLGALEHQLARLVVADERLVEIWQQRNALAGRCVVIEHGNQRHAGHCLHIDRDGALVLDMGGQTVRFLSGSVVEHSS